MWALIDNYDSFTHILRDYFLRCGAECTVIRNDECTLPELVRLNPQRLIVSPGPGTPLEAGISLEAIAHYHDKIPVLGVCLGHQAIGMHFGGSLIRAPYPMHGKTSPVSHDGSSLFHHIPRKFEVMRYHSLAISLPDSSPLRISCSSEDDSVCMAFRHERFPCTGVQFHPESIGTPYGLQLIQNWIDRP